MIVATARKALASSHAKLPAKPKARLGKPEREPGPHSKAERRNANMTNASKMPPIEPIPWPPEALRLAEEHGVELPKPRRFILTVTVPVKTVSEANSRAHFQVKAKRAREQRELAQAVLSEAIVREALDLPDAPAEMVVVITRIGPRELDGDNLARSAKAVRDGVADTLGIDDGDKRVRYEYAQRKGKPKEYAVRIDLLEVGR